MTQNDNRNVVKVLENLERKIGREAINKAAIIIGEGYPNVWSAQVEIILKLYAPFLEEQTFEVAYGGMLALPRSSFSRNQQIKTDMTEEHKEEYYKSIEQRLKAYAVLIERNRAANKSYEIPQFTIEKAGEIAQEAFEESFRKMRDSYKSKQKYQIIFLISQKDNKGDSSQNKHETPLDQR